MYHGTTAGWRLSWRIRATATHRPSGLAASDWTTSAGAWMPCSDAMREWTRGWRPGCSTSNCTSRRASGRSERGTMRLRVVIVDDEDLARLVVREYLAAMPDVEVVAECANGFEAV